MSVSELFDAVVFLTMYLLSETEQRVRASLRDAILLLCQTGLKFNTELSVDGLLAVTLDKKHVFLLSIKETLTANESCSTGEGSTCLYATDDQEVLNFSSNCLSAVMAEGSDNVTVLNSSEEECASNVTSLRLPTEMPNQCVGHNTQRDAESLPKSAEMASRRRRRKQRRTVRRFLDTSCRTASPSVLSLELPSQPEHVLCWTGNEHDDEGEYCKTGMLSDMSDQQAIAADAETSADSDQRTFSNDCDQEHDEAVSSLILPMEDQKQSESETSVSPTPPNNDSVTNSDHIFEQSHSKRSHTVRQHLVSSTCPITSSATMSLESGHTQHIAGCVNNETGITPIDKGVENGRCKMELSDNQSDCAETECQDLSTSFHLSAGIKTEIVEPASASADFASQLASLGHNVQPSADPQQQMAMMSQFGLSAVVASMQSHFALLPKPFPWSVRTFPSLSPPSLPPAQCGVVSITNFVVLIIQMWWLKYHLLYCELVTFV